MARILIYQFQQRYTTGATWQRFCRRPREKDKYWSVQTVLLFLSSEYSCMQRDRATLYLINHRITIRSIFKSMFLFNFYLERVTTSGSAVHWMIITIEDVIHWWNWLGGKKHLTCANWRSCCPGSCSWSSGRGAQPCPAADSGWSVERQINLNSPDKDLRDSMLPSCGEQSELDRVLWGETVDDVFPPYESSSQISAACRPPPHDRQVQFWWMGKLVNFVNEQPLTGNIHVLEFKPTSAEPPVTAPCWSISLRTLKLCFQPERSGWSCFSFPFLFPSA